MISIQQSACNAAVAYLSSALPSDIKIFSRWPGVDFPGKAITLITAGSRRDQPLEPRVLSKTNLGSNQTTAVWEIAECTQPLQLDIWARTHADRDEMIAGLDIALRGGFAGMPEILFRDPVASSFFVSLVDDWAGTNAKFRFDAPSIDDTAESIDRGQFRATYRGTAWMKLTISAVSYRQSAIKLSSYLDGVLPRKVTTITSS